MIPLAEEEGGPHHYYLMVTINHINKRGSGITANLMILLELTARVKGVSPGAAQSVVACEAWFKLHRNRMEATFEAEKA
jgi:hypothetical protein